MKLKSVVLIASLLTVVLPAASFGAERLCGKVKTFMTVEMGGGPGDVAELETGHLVFLDNGQSSSVIFQTALITNRAVCVVGEVRNSTNTRKPIYFPLRMALM